MPGTIHVDQQATFSTPPFVMSAGPKLKFGTDQQDVNTRTGERKWQVQVAVSYFPEYGRSVAEVIEVGILGEDPSAVVQPGMPVLFDRLRVGFSAPEVNNENGRIRGGKPFWQADSVRPFSAASKAAA